MRSLSYDEAKDYLSLIGCSPCPSAEETMRKFENHLCSLPGCSSTHTTHTTTTPQSKDNPMFDNMFNGICGRIKPGNCRLSYTGGVAIRTADGTYKTYNLKTGQLTNCDRFVFDVGDDLFMMIPTRKLKKGDIVLFGGQPKCVIEVLGNKHVKVINYNTAVIEEVVPERHVFMGRRFYGKIVSLMGNGFLKGGKGGMFKNLLKFKMMSSLFGGGKGGGMFNGNGGLGQMMAMSMMMGNGGFGDMFGNMFNGLFGKKKKTDKAAAAKCVDIPSVIPTVDEDGKEDDGE
jgi:hypothetical protein